MESDHQSSLAFVSSKGRLSNTTDEETDAMEITSYQPKYHRTKCCRRSCGEISQCRNNRTFANPEYRFPVQLLHHPGSNETPTNSGLSENKQFYTMSPFQNGGSTRSTRDHREQRLHLQTRPEGCIRGHPYTSKFQEILNISEQRSSLSIQDSSVRHECKPTSIQQTDEVCYRTFETYGHPTSILSRRYLYTGINQGGNPESHKQGIVPFRKLGVFNQLPKKCANPFTTTGVSGICFQHQNNENIRSIEENYQANVPYQTSSESSTSSTQLSLVCQYDGKNDIHDSSNWGCFTSYQAYAERLSDNTPSSSAELECTNDTICRQQERTNMVDRMDDKEEWIANQEDIIKYETDFQYLCRRIGPGMGSELQHHTGYGSLDNNRSLVIYQRERAQSNLFCSRTACQEVSQLPHQDIYRQQNSTEIQQQVGRYSVKGFTRSGRQYTRDMQRVSSRSRIRAYSGKRKHSSRLAKQTRSWQDQQVDIRGESTSKNFSNDKQDLGTAEDRCICRPDQQETASILESETGSGSSCHRCFSADLGKTRNVPVSPMEIYTASSTKYQDTKDTTSSVDHPILANTILVPDHIENETYKSATDIQDRPLENDRLAYINNKRKNVDNLDEDTIEFLTHAQRNNTHRTYNSGWKKWTSWRASQKPKVDPLAYSEKNVLQFLLANRHFSYQYLNGLRSSIASVFKEEHPKQIPIAEQSCIIEFFKAKRRSEVKIPAKHNLQTWDTNILVRFIKKEWPKNSSISLYDLQMKTIMLFCLTTMARPRSDIGRVQYRDIQIELINNVPQSVIVHFREAKEIQVKSTVLGRGEDEDLCLVSTLFDFIQLSKHLRVHLPNDHHLFLAYINEPQKTTSACPSTVATWVMKTMQKAGVDTEVYKPHSIRSASSTKAVENGIAINQVKEHANWSHRSNTFEKHYFKPIAQQNNSTAIANSILSSQGKSTTLESESKSTRIVKGTTNNASVDAEEDENVVTTRPNWSSWLKIPFF